LIRLSLILILILFHGLTDVEDKFVFLVAARPGVAHEIECQIVLANIFGCVELQLDVGLAQSQTLPPRLPLPPRLLPRRNKCLLLPLLHSLKGLLPLLYSVGGKCLLVTVLCWWVCWWLHSLAASGGTSTRSSLLVALLVCGSTPRLVESTASTLSYCLCPLVLCISSTL
jgi:hypothetical protein